MDKQIEINWLEIQKVKPYKYNAKIHSDSQIRDIAEQIHQFGWDQPIVVDKKMEIVKGHGRREAAILLGMKAVPVYIANHLTEEQAMAARLGDNKVAEAPWDHNMLKYSFEKFKSMGFDPTVTGFKPEEIDEIMKGWKSDLAVVEQTEAHTEGIFSVIKIVCRPEVKEELRNFLAETLKTSKFTGVEVGKA
jgi:ParB-like chromosome segregation protein Spo0J